MNRKQHAMQKPCWNRSRADQHTRISGEQRSEESRTENKQAGGDAKKLVHRSGERVKNMQFERDQARNSTSAKRAENPNAHRHSRPIFENTQHVDEEQW